jgi:hypothetical protein
LGSLKDAKLTNARRPEPTDALRAVDCELDRHSVFFVTERVKTQEVLY